MHDHQSVQQSPTAHEGATSSKGSMRWRSLDIAVCGVLGAVFGVIYWGTSALLSWILPLMTAILPGLASLLHGLYYFPVTLSLLIIRKPGAAIYANLVAVLVELLLGNGGYSSGLVLIEAFLQALCAEVVYAIFRYRKWTVGVTVFAGVVVALAYNAFLILFFYQGVSFMSPRGIIGTVCEVVSGVLFAGILSWFLFKEIVATGALDRFSSGQVKATISE